MKDERTEPGMDPTALTVTETLPLLPDVERIFGAFVENANAVLGQARTTLGRVPDSEEVPAADDYPSQKTVLADLVPLDAQDATHPALDADRIAEALMGRTRGAEGAGPGAEPVRTDGREFTDQVTMQGSIFSHNPHGAVTSSGELLAALPGPSDVTRVAAPPPESVAASKPGETTQVARQAEAERLVPKVASVKPAAPPVRERSEDGQIPARELESKMADMAVLLRYGHDEEVARRLVDLRQEYPRDLLLLRRIAEFHLEMGSKELAKESLFQLASSLFQRKNVVGMRAALEQVLVLDPSNARAIKLIGLLDQR